MTRYGRSSRCESCSSRADARCHDTAPTGCEASSKQSATSRSFRPSLHQFERQCCTTPSSPAEPSVSQSSSRSTAKKSHDGRGAQWERDHARRTDHRRARQPAGRERTEPEGRDPVSHLTDRDQARRRDTRRAELFLGEAQCEREHRPAARPATIAQNAVSASDARTALPLSSSSVSARGAAVACGRWLAA
jgi:hypothetical protein